METTTVRSRFLSLETWAGWSYLSPLPCDAGAFLSPRRSRNFRIAGSPHANVLRIRYITFRKRSNTWGQNGVLFSRWNSEISLFKGSKISSSSWALERNQERVFFFAMFIIRKFLIPNSYYLTKKILFISPISGYFQLKVTCYKSSALPVWLKNVKNFLTKINVWETQFLKVYLNLH